jgi:hypothetical protein
VEGHRSVDLGPKSRFKTQIEFAARIMVALRVVINYVKYGRWHRTYESLLECSEGVARRPPDLQSTGQHRPRGAVET